MNGQVNIVDSQQVLGRLARGTEQIREVSIVTAPGDKAAAWAVKIKSNSSHNVYNVVAVVIGDAGSIPVEIGQQTQAVNLAEPYQQQGTLTAGTFAVMFRVGDKNVFYVEP
jgi:hypothetical protein